MNTEKLVAIAGTYLRAAFAAVLALASVAAPILKALDPKEAAFGRGSE